MSGSTHNTVLKKLQSDTVYTVTVVPVYSAGEGQRMSENGKTCKPLHAYNHWSRSQVTMGIHAGMFTSSSDILGRQL